MVLLITLCLEVSLTLCILPVDISWHVKHLPATPTSFEAIVVQPAVISPKAPLIAFPHGGPHSAFPADYMPNVVGFASLGYVVVMVNYRGSTGFGKVCVWMVVF